MNEEQLTFLMKCVKGNLAEKAVECLDELPEKNANAETVSPIYAGAPLERIEEEDEEGRLSSQ